LGPFAPAESTYEYRFSGLQLTVAGDQSGVNWSLFTSDSPDPLPAVPRRFGQVPAGRSRIIRDARARGAFVWLELSNNAGGSGIPEAWAFESGSLGVARAGRARVRSK